MNDHWSGKFLPLLVISVDIGYFPFYYFVVFVLCLYILLINISFSLCIVGGRKVNFFYFLFLEGSLLDIFWKLFWTNIFWKTYCLCWIYFP